MDTEPTDEPEGLDELAALGKKLFKVPKSDVTDPPEESDQD